MLSYGDLLKLCRKSRGLTQLALEERTHISQNVISTYETGSAIPKIDVYSDLIEACGYEIGIREKKSTFSFEEIAVLLGKNGGDND